MLFFSEQLVEKFGFPKADGNGKRGPLNFVESAEMNKRIQKAADEQQYRKQQAAYEEANKEDRLICCLL